MITCILFQTLLRVNWHAMVQGGWEQVRASENQVVRCLRPAFLLESGVRPRPACLGETEAVRCQGCKSHV